MALESASLLPAHDQEGKGPDRRGYLAGTNTRRVKRALFGLFEGVVSKDVVSRVWRKAKVDWDAWSARELADDDIVRLILDGTVFRTRLDGEATKISVLAAIGVRRDGQKVLLSIRNMGGESTASWRLFLEDLDAGGLKRPEFVIVDGAPGLEAALVALWGNDLPIQRCTIHKHRNLLAHAPKHMHDELAEDYRDMIYADTAAEIDKRRKALLRKWRLKGEFRRRIKTQTVQPCAETMLIWALLASGQIQMRKIDGWKTLPQPLDPRPLDLAA